MRERIWKWLATASGTRPGAAPSDAAAPPGARPRWRSLGLDRKTVLVLLLLTGVGGLFQGESSDRLVLTEYAQLFRDPALFSGDDLLKQGVSLYPSFYPRLLALFPAPDFGLFSGMATASVHGLFLLALYLLAFSLFRDRNTALVAAAGGLFTKFALGSVELGVEYLIPRTFVLPLLVVALWLAVEGRWLLAFPILGATAAFHILTALYYVPILALGLLLARPRLDTVKRLVVPGLLALAAAAPALLWLLSLPPVVAPDRGLIEARAPHLFLRNHTLQDWGNFLPFVALLAAGLLWKRERTEGDRRVAAWALVAGGVLLANFLLVEVGGSRWIGEFYRVSVLLLLLGVVYGAHWARRLWTRRGSIARPLAVASILLLVFWPHLRPGFYAERFVLASPDPGARDWGAVQEWARVSTGPTDLFITPPESAGFRAGSQRSIVGTLKDGIHIYFSDYQRAWWSRMEDLGARLDGARIVSDYGGFRESDFHALAAKYGAAYTVVGSSVNLSLSLMYQNPHFRVYRVTP